MPLTLVFKRAKNFVLAGDGDKGTRQFLAQAGPANPIQVPFWVAETSTFEHGIKDGSIVNLTPPAQMPGYKVAVDPEADPEVDAADVDEDEVIQTEVPQAEFGGQPMTPVAPALKIGNVRTGGGRGR